MDGRTGVWTVQNHHPLHGHDSKQATGWFIGTVHSRNVTPTDLKKAPTANFVVEYHAKLTDKKLNGKVSCELTERTHGIDESRVVGGGGAG